MAFHAFRNADRYGKVEHISTSEHAWRYLDDLDELIHPRNHQLRSQNIMPTWLWLQLTSAFRAPGMTLRGHCCRLTWDFDRRHLLYKSAKGESCRRFADIHGAIKLVTFFSYFRYLLLTIAVSLTLCMSFLLQLIHLEDAITIAPYY